MHLVLLIAAWLALLAVPPPASAQATDIIITDLQDIDFGAVSPTAGALITQIDFCVGLDRPGRYEVVARGSGDADQFVLSNGFHDLRYQVRFSDRPHRPGIELTPGVAQMNLRGKKRKPRQNCNRPTASVQITIDAMQLQAAGAGNYQGTLVLTVTPQ